MHRVLVLLVAACGRLGFDTASTGDANAGDGAQIDAAVDAPSGAVTTTFGESATADHQGTTTDTYLNGAPSEIADNYGRADDLRVRQDEHALVRFDVTAIPPTATIFSAELRLSATSVEAAATITVHAVLESWTEGNLDGSVGAANWLQRTDVATWQTAGAGPPSSASAELVSLPIAAVGTATFALPAATVQSWVSSPVTNAGMVLMNASGNRVRFRSSESDDPLRPLLTVTFIP